MWYVTYSIHEHLLFEGVLSKDLKSSQIDNMMNVAFLALDKMDIFMTRKPS